MGNSHLMHFVFVNILKTKVRTIVYPLFNCHGDDKKERIILIHLTQVGGEFNEIPP